MMKFTSSMTTVATKLQYCWAKAPILCTQALQTTHLEQRFFHAGLKSMTGTSVWLKNSHANTYSNCRNLSSNSEKHTKKSSRKLVLFGVGTAVAVTFGLLYSDYRKSKHTAIVNGDSSAPANKEFSKLVTKKVVNPHKNSKYNLTLFQYEPCPFCKKVRAFLDCHGFSYDIVEVNSVTKKELGWSSYKKVPILLMGDDQKSEQLNDSTVIISLLASYLHNPDQDIKDLLKCYPVVSQTDSKGATKSEIMNKYFVMFGDKPPANRSTEEITAERRWRQWCDDVLVHTLSPNVYRTWEESVETFKMFDRNGDWERVFSSFERWVVIYLGAAIMLMISKRLKKKHNIAEDSRQSLYGAVNTFLDAIAKQGTRFMGGSEPNLADLAAYGCLNSIEGTTAFWDLVANTDVLTWYAELKSVIESRRGEMVVS